MDYSISEEGVPDYETSVEGYNLTNTYTPEVVSVPFTKIWKDFDNQDVRTLLLLTYLRMERRLRAEL